MLKFIKYDIYHKKAMKHTKYYEQPIHKSWFIHIFLYYEFLIYQIVYIPQKKMTQLKQALKTETNKQRLKKLITFLQYHAVNILQIWENDSHLSISQFANIMEQKYDYGLNLDELLGLKSIADQGENLYVENFHHLGIWEGQLYEKQYKKRKVVKKQKKRPQTANSIVHRYNYQPERSKPSQSGITINMCQSKTFLTKNSRYKMNEEQLQKKIIENALDKKWDYLIKVGQMNCWIKESQIKEPVTTSQDIKPKVQTTQKSRVYKIETTHQDIKIIEQKQNGESQILPLKVFDQKYLSLKKKFVGQEKTKNNMKGTMLLVLDKKDKVSKAKLNQKISQRDQQLNYLLLEIIRIKNIFQQQDQVLSECGVNM